MKKRAPIVVGLALVVGITALVFSLLPGRRAVSMTLVDYRRWPHGAMVRLSNNTHTTLQYLAEQNGLPTGGPILRLRKTAEGWSTPADGWSITSVRVRKMLIRNPTTGKTTDVFFLQPVNPMQPGDRLASLLIRELRPGQSVDFFIRLEPGAAAQRVGTVYIVPQTKLVRKLQPWLTRIREWCRLKVTVPGQREVWCPDPLSFSASGEPGRGIE